jgi:uncharacterized Zn-finger protein
MLTNTDTKEKPYECDCGESFARRDLLTRHTRQAHSGGNGTDLCPTPDNEDRSASVDTELGGFSQPGTHISEDPEYNSNLSSNSVQPYFSQSLLEGMP